MQRNKSSELVNANPIAPETDPPGGSKSNPMERLLDQADEAVRLGNVQESREHLTRIFEILSGSPSNRIVAHTDPPYRAEAYQMRRSA